MAKRTYEEIAVLVSANNLSKKLSNEFIICLVWKESGFDDSVKNAASSATGLMQMTKAAVKDVNDRCKPAEPISHADMTDAAKNIQCATLYLDLRIKWARDTTKGIEGYGTGKGYSKSIGKCEACLKNPKKHSQECLDAIHT